MPLDSRCSLLAALRLVRLLVLATATVLNLASLDSSAQAQDADPSAATTFQIGVASIDITPNHPIRLNGFGFRRDETAEVGLRLSAQALAIGQGDEPPVVIVTLDSLGIRESMVDEVAKRVAESHQIPRANLVVAFSHSHCTPKVAGACDTIFSTPIPEEHQAHIDRYTERLTNDLTALVQDALDARQPGTLAWSEGTVGFAANRRTAGGPVDHSLPVLIARDANGNLLAIHTSYACHCVTLSYNKFSGDWAGYAREAIERRWPGVIGMVSIGCGSDSNPDSGVTGDGEAIAADQGQQICDEIERLLTHDLTEIKSSPIAKLNHIRLPLDPLPSREQLEALAKEASPAGHNAAWQLERLNAQGSLQDHLDYPVQTIRFGDELGMVFLAGEVCVDYALRLKRELNAERLWTVGYANDFCAYIPSERLRQEGGYGGGAEVVYFALPATLAPGLEQPIIDEVKRQLPETWQVELGTDGVPPSSPKSSQRKFRIDPAYSIQAVAAEPLIADPVAIDFAPDGKLWVCEMTDYARSVDGEFEPSGRVRFLVDRDQDGIFDESTVFLEGLRFPTDVKVWRDGVLICDAPQILLARDSDTDGKADDVRTLLEGFATHNPHARVNSLRWNIDGWLYGSCGLFGGSIQVFADEPEPREIGERYELGGRDFRWKPDTGEFEAVTGSTQQGRARDDFQRWYGCDNSTLIRHYPIAVGPSPADLNSPASSIDPTINDAPGTLYPPRDLVLFALSGPAGRPTSACGLEIFRSNAWGSAAYGNSFTCEPVNQLVHRRVLNDEPSGVRALRADNEQDREFLTSTDRWFRPVQVRTGPDGQLWVVDMVRYVIEHPQWIPEEVRDRTNVFAGQGLGRVWRVALRDIDSNGGWPILSADDDAALLAAIASDNGAQRDLAHQQILWHSRLDLVEEIEQVATTSVWPATRVQAWYLLEQLSGLSRESLEAMSKESDSDAIAALVPLVRQQVIELDNRELIKSWIEQVSDPSAPSSLRRAVAGFLASMKDTSSISRAIEQLSHSSDPWQRYELLRYVSDENRDAWRSAAWERLNTGDSIPADLAAVLIADDMNAQQWLAAVERLQEVAGPEILLRDHAQSVVERLELTRPDTVQAAQLSAEVRTVWLVGLELQEQRLGEPGVDVGLTNRLLRARWLIPDISQRLSTWLSPQAPFSTQRAVAQTLATESGSTQTLLRDAMVNSSPSLQAIVIDGWLERDATRETFAKWLNRSPELANWMTRDQQLRLLESLDEESANSFRERWSISQAPEEGELLARYLSVIEQPADAVRGAKLFDQHCGACHLLDSKGSRLGPDLDALSQPTPQSLVRSILLPSSDIDAKYRSVSLETDDGRTVVGLLIDEGDTSVVVQTSPTERESIPRSGIISLESRRVSFMPERLHETLDPEAVRDLIAYLQTPRTPAKAFEGNEPRVILVGSQNPIELPSSAAEIRGGEIGFETLHGNVGFWHGSTDSVTWLLEVEQAGAYRVELDYSCDPGSAGNRARVSCGVSEATVEIAATAGWSDYQSLDAGNLHLPQGRARLVVLPDGSLTGALCDLRGVRLVKVAEEE